tara:strand:+ start:2739 stop:3575 length:837 start_codon:yes stop_codon:yes gene_type:complete
MNLGIFIGVIVIIVVLNAASCYLLFSDFDTRLETEQQILPWSSIAIIPVAATIIAAMEIETEGRFGWSAMIPTKRLIGGFTAYHFCLALSVITLLHFTWLFVDPEDINSGIQLERGILVCVIALFLFEDMAWQLMNPQTNCSNKLCVRNLQSGAFKNLNPYLMYALLFSLAALVGVDPTVYPMLVSMLVITLILTILFPGAFIRNAYKSRRISAEKLLEKYDFDANFKEGQKNLNAISEKYGINGLRTFLQTLKPTNNLYGTGANIKMKQLNAIPDEV